MSKHNKINVVTLGCAKNVVDSEVLSGIIEENGINVVFNESSNSAKTVIINTCGFINDAKQESIDTILQYAKAKQQGLINNLFVIGCLSERYKSELKNEIPEADEYFGVNDVKAIVERISGKPFKSENIHRKISTLSHYAYLKIAEGCNRTCSFCAIPLIRGKYCSKKIEEILSEAEYLANSGVKELIVIAQDTTFYGLDIYGKQQLGFLLDELSKISGIEWIRLHYTYPSNFPEDVIETIKTNKKICKYLDIPIQHISDNVLKMMRRNSTKAEIVNLIKQIRKEIPDITLRTTILVGHPGETENDFDELCKFIREIKFDRLGVFTYSEEEGTFSAMNFVDELPQKIKNKRLNAMMKIQKKISYELNLNKIGKTYTSIIDRKEGEFFIGRTEADSPEIDNEIVIHSNHQPLEIGKFYNVTIKKSDYYDLFGEII